MPTVHPTAILGKNVEMGMGNTIGPYAILEDGVRLADLKKQEPVTVDYLEDGRTARALQIKRVPMKGVPKEIRRF